MRIPDHDELDGESMVNLTPLIDVVFLLLIFFMVTSTFQIDERDLSIQVPEAENGNPLEDLPETLVVGIRKDGSFRIGQETLDKEQLRDVLKRARRKNENQRVIVRADQDVPTKHPVSVLDLCAGMEIPTSIATSEVN